MLDKNSPIAKRIDTLQKNASELDTICMRLKSRLAPVLKPAPPMPTPKEVKPLNVSELEAIISAISGKINNSRECLEDLVNRLII